MFVGDVDDAYGRALGAGAAALRAPADRFYGNREAGVVDPLGNLWWLAQVVERVPRDELQQRYEQTIS